MKTVTIFEHENEEMHLHYSDEGCKFRVSLGTRNESGNMYREDVISSVNTDLEIAQDGVK